MVHLNYSALNTNKLADLVNNFDCDEIRDFIKEIIKKSPFTIEEAESFIKLHMYLILQGISSEQRLKEAMFENVVNIILAQEQDEQLGYYKYDHTDGDNAYINDKGIKDRRNGTRNKKIKTTFSDEPKIIKIPRNRTTKFESKFLKKDLYGNSLIEQVDEIIIKYYTQGLSIDQIIQNLKLVCKINLTTTYVQKVIKNLTPLVNEWLDRLLSKRYLVAFCDCIFINLRDKVNRTVSKVPVYITIGITEEGHKEVIHVSIDKTESAKTWTEIFLSLKERGVETINILCADGLPGMEYAFKSVFENGEFQTCCVHLFRNCIKYVNYRDKREVSSLIWNIIKADNEEKAKEALYVLIDKWGKRYHTTIRKLENNWSKFATIFKFPQEVRRQIYTTNIIESFNRLIRKATKNQTSFTSVEGLLTSIYLVSIQYEKKHGINPAPTWNSTKYAIEKYLSQDN